MLDMRIAAIALGGSFEVGFAETGGLCRRTAESLRAQGVEVLDCGVVVCDLETMRRARDFLADKSFDALLVCVGTWSEDHHLLDLMASFPKPVILHAYPDYESGSLCGVQQIGSVFRDIGFTDFRFVFGEAGGEAATAELLEALRGIRLRERLRHMRFGNIGSRCAGMTETAFDEFALLEHIGARIVTLDESELLEAVAQADDAETDRVCRTLRRRFANITADEAGLTESVRYYLAIRGLCRRYGLSGLTVKCYTKYMGRVCLAGSLLAEEGIVLSCEGDVNNVVMMKILQELSGGDVNCTDILQPNEAENTILFGHCGNTGFSMAASQAEIELAPVRLAERGVCCKFTCRPGAVTAADLVGHGGTLRMSVLEAEAVPCGMEFPGSPIKLRCRAPVLRLCREIVQRGCGHHWMITYGSHAAQLQDYCRKAGIEYILLDPA